MHLRVALTLCALFAGTPVSAADDTVFRIMLEKCGAERQTFCGRVAPKDIRIAACLYAHEDKASAECSIAIYDGMLAMQIAIGTVSAYIRNCRADLLKFCATTKPGEGRLYACLVENKSALTNGCREQLDPARTDLEQLGLVK